MYVFILEFSDLQLLVILLHTPLIITATTCGHDCGKKAYLSVIIR